MALPVYATAVKPNPLIKKLSPLQLATIEIAQKAKELGVGFTGSSTSSVTPIDAPGVVDGFQEIFANCTIFYSPTTGAHEVHGDILRKYVTLPLKNMNLGLPTTDETGAPDGAGRYNHFSNDASIYWHPNTGPMAVQGAVRDRWSSQGWERGPLGYPVRDVFFPASGEIAGDFQNGVIWIGPSGYQDAKVATMPSSELLDFIWHQFDTVVQQSPNNVGLHPEKSFDGVTDTGYGFAQSLNRGFKVTINAFHDDGLLPDANFTIRMAVVLTLGYTLAQDRSIDYTIGALVEDISVSNSGLVSTIIGLATNEFTDKITQSIQASSDGGISSGLTFSEAAPLLSLKLMADGSLNFFLSPTTAGEVAQARIQTTIYSLEQQ